MRAASKTRLETTPKDCAKAGLHDHQISKPVGRLPYSSEVCVYPRGLPKNDMRYNGQVSRDRTRNAPASLVNAFFLMVRKSAATKMNINEYEQCRLADMVNGNGVIRFYENCPDNEYPNIFWSAYGDPMTGVVIVSAKKGSLAYYNSASSWLLIPPMADRIFGIDVLDEALAQKLGVELWAKVGMHLSIYKGSNR